MNDFSDWMTTKDAAKLAGYHVDYMRQLAKSGEVEARKFGYTWMVSKKSLLDYMKRISESGAKRGPKSKDS